MANGNHTPNDIENSPPNSLATLLRSELDALYPLSSMCCIYRVSESLRRGNDRAYTPQVVSIGPFHHGKEKLKPMEEHKKRYLEKFLTRTEKSLEDCIEMIRQKEQLLRNYYAERIEFTSDDFVKIVLIDAAFIIEVLRYPPKLRNEFGWIMFKDICNDLLLLENQLPFFILKKLWKIISSADGRRLSILDCSYGLFQFARQITGKDDKLRSLSPSNVVHFVDLLRSLYVPLSGSGGKINTLTIPRMTQLHRAGVKFRVRSSENLFDLRFSKGVLEIPKFQIFDSTELTIRNLVAFEQYRCTENYLTDYVVMMTNLVDTPEDVGLLVKYEIIENGLGDNADVSTLINKLGEEVLFDSSNFYFAKIFEELGDYCRTPRHKWQANLKQNYFNTPWAIISVIAAILLIILTIIQAVCSVISVIH